jgi:two-component system, NarL family, response regulator NreC
MKPGSLYALPDPGSGSAARRTPISVVLADDHAFMRRSLRLLLDGGAEFEVVAEASDIPTVLLHVRGLLPHVLVLDLTMPDGSSLTTIRRLRSEVPNTEIVATTMTDDPRLASEAIAAGASGYVLKDDAHRDLPEAVRRAARGESFVTPRLGSVLAAYTDGDTDRLSEREVDVLRLIALGHTNAEVGRLLKISVRTVETHRAHIHRKLGLSTRAQLVRYALRRGLLAAPAPSPLEAIR